MNSYHLAGSAAALLSLFCDLGHGAAPTYLQSRPLVYEINFRQTPGLQKPWTFRAPGSERGYLNDPSAVSFSKKEGLEIRTQFLPSYSVSGMVSTQGALYVRGGYIEATVVLPKLTGHHCAFWLKSDEYDRVGPSYEVGVELDVFEFHNNTPKVFYSTVHSQGYGAAHVFVQRTSALPARYPGSDIRFAVDWRPDGYAFYVNGSLAARINDYPSWIPMYLILSCHPSQWGGAPPTTGTMVDVYKVRGVRVYQNSNAGESLNRR